MVVRYESEIEIRKGDCVLLHDEPGEIEFVAAEPGDAETDRYVRQYGGVMVAEPKLFSHAFLSAEILENAELLQPAGRESRSRLR